MAGLENGRTARARGALLALLVLVAVFAVPAVASARVRAMPLANPIIQGRVTDPDGNGVGQACIEVYKNVGGVWEVVHSPGFGGWNQEYTQTNAAPGFTGTNIGKYYIDDLAPGTYRLRVVDRYGDYENRDWVFVSEFYDNRADVFTANSQVFDLGGSYTLNFQVAIEEYGTGTGFITDAVTGKGTYDVGVNFYRADGFGGWEWVQGGGSNCLGDWTTDIIPSGSYKVQFTDDYGRYSSQWFGGDGTFAASPLVTIAPNYVTHGISAVMDRSSSISGNVTNPNGTGEKGVWPLAYRWDAFEGAWMEANDTGLQQSTDATGFYTVSGLDAGSYKIRFVPDEKKDFYNNYLADQVFGASAGATFSPAAPMDWTTYEQQLAKGTTITLPANTDLPGKNAALKWGGFLTGRVHLPSGADRPWYHVTVRNSAVPSEVVAEVWTEDDGTWTVRNLASVTSSPAATYKVRFDDESDVYAPYEGPGFYYATRWRKSATETVLATGSAVAVGFGAGSGDGMVDCTITPTAGNWGNLDGTITDKTKGKALEGMTVGLNCWSGNTVTGGWTEIATARTDSKGRYSFTEVPCRPVLQYVILRAYQDSWDSGLDAGSVYEDTFAEGKDLASAYNGGVYVTSAATTTVNIPMPVRTVSEWGAESMGAIVGTVSPDGSGVPVPGVPVVFFKWDPVMAEWYYAGQVKTNGYGAYCTGLVAGQYRVQFGPTVALADEYYSNIQVFASAATVTITASSTVYTSADASLTAACRISGTVRDGSGAALEGAEVNAYAYNAVWNTWGPVSYAQADASIDAAAARTGADGTYTIGGLKSGVNYRVGFSKWAEGDMYPPDWNRTYWRSGGTAQSIDQAMDVTMAPAATRSGIDGTLTAGSYLRGSLTDGDGKRVGGIHVKLWQKTGGQWNQINSTYSSTGGDFQFEAFGAGQYYLKFEDDTNFLYRTRWFKASDLTSAGAEPIDFIGGDAKVVTATVQAMDTTYTPIFGATRYDTAVNAAYEAFPFGASTVVISTGENWPDALGGSALAGAYDGPMLLVKRYELPANVADCIDTLGATKAIIIGGTGAVSPATLSAVAAHVGGAGHVTRIAGSTRYETARLVAEATIHRLGAAYEGTDTASAFVATGRNFPDALGASPLAASASWPIYLVDPDTGITPATLGSMTSHGVHTAIILGGTGAVTSGTEGTLNATFGAANVHRLGGAGRYETAAIIAEYGVDHAYGLGWNNVAFATGVNFPDALAGGVLQGMTGSVLLLTGPTTLDPHVASVLTAHKATIADVRYLGGTSAVTMTVRNAISALLN